MTNIQIHLYKDWIDTVKEIFRGSGHPLPEDIDDSDAALAYFMLTAASEDEALKQRTANEERLMQLQRTILVNLDSVIWPDIRCKTGYAGDRLSFKWVYHKGEHIIEEQSSYRIPL
ncbi:hypothetical protein [Paenibacillus harenae]|uniref:hypothetical protein n=1 Tax=Paenibacillus harenae TaxID=306543 RepID=UPI0003FAC719|nr:hypothetical protein [Paenibacillus harenae]